MTTFSIRVELHDASWADYDTLHENLAAIGVNDVINGSDGVTYKLPPAEYTLESDQTRSAVLDAVHAIATKVRRNPGVFVTQSNGRTWKGLQKAG